MADQDALARAIAANVRAARAARRWSLDRLAALSGLSKGVLVAIEQGRGNPSIGTLWRIAEAFGTGLAQLVEVEREPPLRVAEPGTGAVLWRGTAGGAGTLLLGGDRPVVELWHWTMRPGEEHHSDPHAPGVRELLLVVEGEIELRVAGQRARIAAGGAASFAGDRPHGYLAVGEVPCRFAMTVLAPEPAGAAAQDTPG
ncbi:XRE family transcriptional regulator [Gandjariella thermophila]|uniref:XRE family transcriptional regulator n=1 Tax=Gandjariella thermophila TaxID=1931992 RepID=A0A4D4JC79_9PSEU|nr:XRE family transcriptional regulator [Gandjariella thermophila]GDY32962.1 XRE family transcriptional regulator [Gandjariella thermophila]